MFASSSSGICDCFCIWCFVVNIIMSKKSVLRFTLKELNALIQDENARVVLQRSIRKLPLQPYCLSDLRGSIHEVLDANLAKFDHELKGILLCYKNIKIVKNVANVLYDDSRLYLTIQADFYLFMPEVGCVLRGIVNKRSADHIGCLVHKAFNVSIPRPECETDEDWQGYYVEIGQEITFRVESLDLTGSLPYMLGHLLDLGSLSNPNEQKTTLKEDVFAAISKFNGFMEQHEDPHTSVHTTEHKKKKKPKNITDFESGANLQDKVLLKHERYDSSLEKDNQEHDEYGSVLKTPKKKKRKNTDQIAPIKQEMLEYRVDDGKDNDYCNQQEEEQLLYDEQILHSEKQICNSYNSLANDHLNVTVNLKKKKRKYEEAFYDNENDDENHTFSTQEENVKHKKKKKNKKEKHGIEVSNADEIVEGDFSIDTSQDLTNQDKKRKKKKKTDVTEEISADLKEEIEFRRTDTHDSHMAKDGLPIYSPNISNTSEEHITEMKFSQKLLKKLGKKVKPLLTDEFLTSTPVEHKSNKDNSFSDSISRRKCSTDSHSGFKQSNLLESMEHLSPSHSLTFKEKHPKKERESSPAVLSDTVPVKVKKLKKEKRLTSSQQEPDKIISETYKHSGSHHGLFYPETSQPWSDTENVTSATTQINSRNISLTDVREAEHKNKKRDSSDKLNKQPIKNTLESPVESKMKMIKKESRLSLNKKGSIEIDVKKIMKADSYTNNIGDLDDDETNSYHQMVAECRESGKGQVSNRLVEYMTNIKKQPSIVRKNLTPPMKATSSSVLDGNASEEGNSPDEGNLLKNIPKLRRTPSSESSPKHSRGTVINHSSSQTAKSSDRAYSPDSGLSLSGTSAEKDSSNLTGRGSKREVEPMYSGESPKDGRNMKEQAKILQKTPKRKKISDVEEGSSHSTIKHKIKKEKESPVKDDGSLEATRMKILADVIKKLGNENKDISTKDENHKPLSASAVKARRQSKQEDTMSDSDLNTSKSKKTYKRKESSKSKVRRKSIGDVDCMQQLGAASDLRHCAEKLSSSSTIHTGEKELDGNRNCLGEGSPFAVQANISGKSPRRKSSTGTEGRSSKQVTKSPVKIKEKESPKKRKTMSSFESDNKEANSLEEESPGAMADRLLEDFLKRRSL